MININRGKKDKREKTEREIPFLLSVYTSIDNNENMKVQII